jgi:hypothetical protein
LPVGDQAPDRPARVRVLGQFDGKQSRGVRLQLSLRLPA